MYRIASLTACCVLALGVTAYANTSISASEQALEKSFDSHIQPAEIGSWIKLMAAEPNQVGSPHDKQNAEWVLAQFKKFGWDAHIETFQVLYPTPISETVELLGKKPFKATLQEPPIPGDTSARATQYALPAYLAYQGDGDVTAPMVYVNYGMRDDYKQLQRLGISVKGKIVVARYGAGWRGLKPLLAQEHGAVGCLIYSDPSGDGYSTGAVYPKGGARPPHGIQRGSVEDMTLYPGDPLTPGVGATADAKRLTRAESKVILKIPALPISYADAQVLLSSMTGRVVPENWRGTLPITYRVGPSDRKLHLAVKSDWSLKPVYDVIAKMKGSEYPDQWVMRGNHRDGWVFGASDPLSGQAAMLEEAKSMGELAKAGWQPKRTIVYASWDGEEPGLLGSTEWAEEHAAELKQKAIAYINSDNNGRGYLYVGGSHDLQHFVNGVADGVTDPETHVSIGQRHRAGVRAEAMSPSARPDLKEEAKIDADASKDFQLFALGSGSDYSAYLEHLGLRTLDVGFGGEDHAGGVYHSRYDTYEHHSRFDDPGFVYDALLAHTVGHMVLRMADAELPVVQAGDFADTVSMYLGQVKKLADHQREAAVVQNKAIADHVFADTFDPTMTNGLPTAMKPVPKFDFAPMDAAVKQLETSAKAYDAAFAADSATLSPDARAKLWAAIQPLDQTLAPQNVGLPGGRGWYKNLIYAPGRYTGYGAKTLPGIREAIEDERFGDAVKYIGLTADALNAYSAQLDKATAVLTGK